MHNGNVGFVSPDCLCPVGHIDLGQVKTSVRRPQDPSQMETQVEDWNQNMVPEHVAEASEDEGIKEKKVKGTFKAILHFWWTGLEYFHKSVYII